MRRRWLVAASVAVVFSGLAVTAIVRGRGPQEPRPDPRPRHVILIDWDGFDPDYLGRVPMPNLDALIARGSLSLAQSTFPTLSNSARASMVTGAYPERHGNVAFTFDSAAGVVRGQDRTVLAETITEALLASGRSLAAVQWYMVEDRGAYAGDTRHLYVEPGGTFADRVTVAIDILSQRPVLAGGGDAAVPVIVPAVPDFLAVYGDDLDALAHQQGTAGANVGPLLAELDAQLGRLVQATRDLGIYDLTTFLLTSDHGMTDWNRTALPEVLAAVSSAGYVPEVIGPSTAPTTPAPETEVVIVPTAVTTATIVLRGRAATDDGRRAVRSAIEGLGPDLIRRVLGRDDLRALRAGDALGDLVVEAQPHYGFAVNPPFLGLTRAAHGSSGEMTVPFVVAGRGFKAGVTLVDPKLVDVAPTIASLLGIRPPAQAQGRVLSRTSG